MGIEKGGVGFESSCRSLHIRFGECEWPARQLTTRLQHQHDIRAARIGDQIAGIVDWRFCEPHAAFTLIDEDPLDALQQPRIVGRNAEFPGKHNVQASTITITCVDPE